MVDAAVDTIREVDVLGLVVDVTEPPGKGDRFVLDLVKDAKAPVFLDPEQDRSDQEVAAAADRCSSTARWGALPRSSRCRRRPATTSTGSSARIIDRLPEGRAAVSGRLPDRPAGALLRRRDRPREAAAVHARRDPVFERGGRRPVRGAGRGRGGAAAAVLHDRRRPRVAEADRGRPRRRDDQADRHGRARGARAVLRRRGCFSTCTCACKSEWREDERRA